MTCYNPYKWSIKINGKKWKFGVLEVDGKKENIWYLESEKGGIIIKNDKNLKKNLIFFSQTKSDRPVNNVFPYS